ncbi:hypothetical protein E3N88_14646 [Mikania micrantha]|uniref:Uncharacterized protein n=1 Tax=Mikania micrantha TaxID=192012 RepID=A0A5N6P4L9_9ASTR|nr:hypothetical protein E3N88_14646 [Mikania micrantha]
MRNNRQTGRIQAGREIANKYDGGDLLRGYREGGYRLRRVRRPLRLQRKEGGRLWRRRRGRLLTTAAMAREETSKLAMVKAREENEREGRAFE